MTVSGRDVDGSERTSLPTGHGAEPKTPQDQSADAPVDSPEFASGRYSLFPSGVFVNAVLQSVGAFIVVLDAQGNVVVFNRACERLLGRSFEELRGRPAWGLLSNAKDVEIAKAVVARALAGSEEFTEETQWQAPNGEMRWMVRTVRGLFNLPGGPHVLVTGIDITDRKAAELAREEGGRRYRALVDASPDSVVLTGPRGEIIAANPQTATLHGFASLDEMLKHTRNVADLMLPDDVPAVMAKPDPPASVGHVVTRYCTGLRWDGSRFPMELRVKAIHGADGNLEGAVAVGRDISERRKAGEALAAEAERLRVTLRSIGDAVLTTDTQGRVELINSSAERLTGWTQAEAAGKPVGEVFQTVRGDTRTSQVDLVERVLRAADDGVVWDEAILAARNGAERIVSGSATPIRDVGGRILGAVVVCRDSTEERRMQQDLLQAQKLESLGLLAGGIAHDFNNIMTGVLGYVGLAKMHSTPGGDAYSRLVEAEKAVARARGVTERLLAFAKGGEPVRRKMHIGDLVRDSTALAMRGLNVSCELAIPTDLWPCDIDEGQIEQVISNLVINACEAMPNGGTVRVCANNEEVKPGAGMHLLPAPYVRISVIDQGVGIPLANRTRVFDPFFTTKPSGSGLGLASTCAIVKKHGGHIDIESEAGRGSAFHIYLPAMPGAKTTPRSRPPRLATHNGRVLVADDQIALRDVACRMLRFLGYEPTPASNGTEAIEEHKLAWERGHRFDAVIVALTDPGAMGSVEVLRRMQQVDPDVVAVASSGDLDDSISDDDTLQGFSGVVRKPYTVEELNSVLLDALGDSPTRPRFH